MTKIKLWGWLALLMLFFPLSSNAETLNRHPLDPPRGLDGIVFDENLSEEEQIKILEYYQADSNKIFNDTYATQKFNSDQAMIARTLTNKNSDSTLFVKERDGAGEYTSARSPYLGTAGDILVTYSFSSIGINFALPGHAAIVHLNPRFTIESFPSRNLKGSTGKADGVRIYPNKWKKENRVYGIRVRRASRGQYRAAAQYAITQANMRKSYNPNFFNKGTTQKFYCSQLVWRAWKNQGFDIDRSNFGDWDPVSPAELVGGRNTYAFYKK